MPTKTAILNTTSEMFDQKEHQKTLDETSKWLKSTTFTLNTDKTKLMVFKKAEVI